jgi:adenine deaminase
MIMFCSDDLHPFDLEKGHINLLVKRAVAMGFDLFDVLCAVSLNPVVHYHIPVGLLRVGDDADFIVVDNLEDFNVLETYIQGKLVAKDNKSTFELEATRVVNNFNIGAIGKEQIELYTNSSSKVKVIQAVDGSLVTNSLIENVKIENGFAVSDVEKDILKIVVVNRYTSAKPSVGFVKGFGLKRGALATSVAHDSHNIISVGVSDELITRAVNLIIENKGGMAYVDENVEHILPLPIAGLMSVQPIEKVSAKYLEIEDAVKNAGSQLSSPLMTLSFMSLLVIPSLKIGDRGLFDVEKFQFTNVFVE